MSRTWSTVIALLAVLILVVGTIGCGQGRPKTVPVSGTVTLDGQPVDGASVTFYPASGGRPAMGTTDAQGNFTLTTFEKGDGAIPGTYNVTVTKVAAGEASPDEQSDTGEALMGAEDTEGKSLLPVKYSSVKTSGLTVEVKAGMEPVTLALQSGE